MVEAEGRTIFKDPDSIAHSANLLVCIGGLASATGMIAGAGAAVGGFLSYREISKRLPAATKRLAEELGSELQKKLAEPGLNDDTRRLIPQMIEASLPSPQRIMEAGHDSAALVEMMAARLTDKEHSNPDHIGPFKRIVGHLLERLLADPQFANELAPAFRKQVLADAQTIKAGIEGLERQFGSVAQALTHVGALGKANRDQLEALASRFEIDRVFEIGDADLRALLEAKAEEYRNYKAQIDMIDERIASLGNLKAAAQEAAERLDLEEVENLLSMVHATELDIAAKTADLRADNALLRGRVDEAYRMISAAADSFAAIDPREPARRLTYDHRLAENALRFGGTGFLRTIDMKRSAIAIVETKGEKGSIWADAHVALANALKIQGARTGGADGAALIAEAIDAYRAALRVYTETDHPADWAMTQNNLAVALSNQGTRTGGADGAALIAEAIDAYRAALRVYTETDHPVDWAMTQNNLANALRNQGERTGGADGAALIAEAVDAYRAALRVYTETDHPVQWATTQNNLAVALYDQGARTGGADGAALIAEAVDAYRAALRVRTETDHPVDWAMTRENMALAEEALADHDTCTDPRPHLQAALDHLDAALRVFDPEHMPYNFEKATRVRARIQAKLDALD
ncbi:tetratricopeptide repeat protein [Oricola indica]|uniref:tetratricopeptide repeat protein n=1 Tax=Oricola indica TaxID=2872591 RepID=UPI001CC0F3AE|nr:tetratricopeptide repeat protein [Oricola indica]